MGDTVYQDEVGTLKLHAGKLLYTIFSSGWLVFLGPRGNCNEFYSWSLRHIFITIVKDGNVLPCDA